MESIISTAMADIPKPRTKVPVEKTTTGIDITMPERGTVGSVRIGKLLEPVQQIIDHPDRKKLMAEFFKDDS